jgi:hypothetical protein
MLVDAIAPMVPANSIANSPSLSFFPSMIIFMSFDHSFSYRMNFLFQDSSSFFTEKIIR